ncbi:MAG: hypothetical protein ACHQK8_05165, partial [Bacteroidia bacterium]
YSPIRLLSFGAELSSGILWGGGIAKVPIYSPENNFAGYKQLGFSYNTEFYSWSGRGYLNVQKLFMNSAPKNMILYLYSGLGFMRTRSASETVDRTQTNVIYNTYFTTYAGLELRIKGTGKLDYLVTLQDNMTETIYLDALPYKKFHDNFFTVSFGVSYSLCPDKKCTFIDWTRKAGCCGGRY